MGQDGWVQISARADYALRALCVLATAPDQCAVKADEIASAQGIPRTFLDGILVELRRAGMIESRRGQRPENHTYDGAARHLQDVWVAVRASLRSILELTTVAQVVEGRLPDTVVAYTSQDRSWQSVWPGQDP